jgi:prepilin-type N-terminal cleavage/methylation domain-containing protein
MISIGQGKMDKAGKRKKGFTLLELMISMVISFVLLLVIYNAFFLAKTLFDMGGDVVQEQHYVRTLFAKIGDELQFASRLSNLSTGKNELEYEIFNSNVLEVESGSNDKKVEGHQIFYTTADKSDDRGNEFVVLEKQTNVYEWWMKFGHSQMPNDDVEPRGYPVDMKDEATGRKETIVGEKTEVLEQEVGKEFLLKSIKFIPFDKEGKDMTTYISGGEKGFDYDMLKSVRSMRVDLEYLIAGDYGDQATPSARKKTASKSIIFISFTTDSMTTGEVVMLDSVPNLFDFFNLKKVSAVFNNANSAVFSPLMPVLH